MKLLKKRVGRIFIWIGLSVFLIYHCTSNSWKVNGNSINMVDSLPSGTPILTYDCNHAYEWCCDSGSKGGWFNWSCGYRAWIRIGRLFGNRGDCGFMAGDVHKYICDFLQAIAQVQNDRTWGINFDKTNYIQATVTDGPHSCTIASQIHCGYGYEKKACYRAGEQ